MSYKPFTDDDLKRLLQQSIANGASGYNMEINSREVIALLARLEAAEKALELWEDEKQISSAKMIDVAMEAWRKACGK
jgi:hypothetical protein